MLLYSIVFTQVHISDLKCIIVFFFFVKCLWKLTRKIPEILTNINVEELFLDLDKFFTFYTSLPSTPSDETPFRTVKTIIYHIINIMGAKVILCYISAYS